MNWRSGPLNKVPIIRAPASYSTTFAGSAQNPISENGVWVHNSPTGDESVVATAIAADSTHYAHGTMAGGQGYPPTPVSGTYNDSSAYLKGFGPNHYAQGTIWKSPTISGSVQECEILLRWTDGLTERSTFWGPSTAIGYEMNVNVDDGSYLNIAQFKTPPASILATVNLTTVIGRVPATGDLFKASIQTVGANALITVYWNGTQVLQATDTSPILTGNPGMGFYQNAGESNTEFGFSAFLAQEF